MNLKDINEILFQNDPMNLYCRENDLYDEYLPEAKQIENLINAGRDTRTAVLEVFDMYFTGAFSEHKLDSTINQLKAILEV
jgi:hypothetical protein